jgi:hypothetical protein
MNQKTLPIKIFKKTSNNLLQSPCIVNHGKYVTLQSNDVVECEIGKSHVAFSHGQNLYYTSGNVRIDYNHAR